MKWGALVRAGALAGLAAGAAALAAAPAASAAGCQLMSDAAIAKAIGFAHSLDQHSSATQPGNGSGSLGVHCGVGVWNGGVPKTPAQLYSKINSGNAATVIINTREEDAGSPQAPVWRENEFTNEWTAAVTGSSNALLKALHGSHFTISRLGAESAIGYQAKKSGRQEAIGIWADPALFKFIDVDVVIGGGRSAPTDVNKLAKAVVKGFL